MIIGTAMEATCSGLSWCWRVRYSTSSDPMNVFDLRSSCNILGEPRSDRAQNHGHSSEESSDSCAGRRGATSCGRRGATSCGRRGATSCGRRASTSCGRRGATSCGRRASTTFRRSSQTMGQASLQDVVPHFPSVIGVGTDFWLRSRRHRFDIHFRRRVLES